MLQWDGIEEIGAVNQSGTWFRGATTDSGRLTHATKPFVASHASGMSGATATTHFEDTVVTASAVLMSAQVPQFNLYLAAFGTHAANAALARLKIVNYSMTLGGNDVGMHARPVIRTTIDQSVDAAYQHLVRVL